MIPRALLYPRCSNAIIDCTEPMSGRLSGRHGTIDFEFVARQLSDAFFSTHDRVVISNANDIQVTRRVVCSLSYVATSLPNQARSKASRFARRGFVRAAIEPNCDCSFRLQKSMCFETDITGIAT